MPNFVIYVAKPAQKQIRQLDRKGRRTVIKALERLELNPRPPRSEKLGGHPPFRRVRAGDFRIIYAIEDLIVVILRVRSRKDAYYGLDDLSPQLADVLIALAESTMERMPTVGSA